jgi:hypothetical protein
MRIGFTVSFSQPCSGHSNLCGNLIAPGTGFTTSFALHFGQFKRSPFAAILTPGRGLIPTWQYTHGRSLPRVISGLPEVTSSRFLWRP